MIKTDYDLATEQGVRAAVADSRYLGARYERFGGGVYSLVFRDADSPSGKWSIGLVDPNQFDHLIPSVETGPI